MFRWRPAYVVDAWINREEKQMIASRLGLVGQLKRLADRNKTLAAECIRLRSKISIGGR